MICTPCTAGNHHDCRECGCQHRPHAETRAPKQEVVQGSGNFSEPPSDLLAPAKISDPSLDLLPPGPLNVDCSTCGAVALQPCHTVGLDGEQRNYDNFHSARHKRAAVEQCGAKHQAGWVHSCLLPIGHAGPHSDVVFAWADYDGPVSPELDLTRRCEMRAANGQQCCSVYGHSDDHRYALRFVDTSPAVTSPIEAEPVSLPGNDACPTRLGYRCDRKHRAPDPNPAWHYNFEEDFWWTSDDTTLHSMLTPASPELVGMRWGETRSRCGASHLETGSRCVYVQGHQGDHRWEFEEDTAMADAVIERDEWPASDGVPFEPHLQEIHDGMAERGLFAVEPHTGDPEEDAALEEIAVETVTPWSQRVDLAVETYIVFCDEPYPTSPSFAPSCEREDGHPGQHFNGKTWWGPHAAEILQREKDAADPPKS